MTKNTVRGYIVLTIIVIAFCVVSFAATFYHNEVFWIALSFGLVSILAQLYVFKKAFVIGGDAKSKFYGFPIARVGIIYVYVQLVVSIVEMIRAEWIPWFVALIINVVIFAAAAIGLIAVEAIRDEIERQDKELKINVTNMRSLQSMSASLVGQCNNNELKASLQKLADEFKYSDPVSSNRTISFENELYVQISELQKSVLEGDVESSQALCSRISVKLSERNRICKLNK